MPITKNIYPIGIRKNGSLRTPSDATSDPIILYTIIERMPKTKGMMINRYFFLIFILIINILIISRSENFSVLTIFPHQALLLVLYNISKSHLYILQFYSPLG